MTINHEFLVYVLKKCIMPSEFLFIIKKTNANIKWITGGHSNIIIPPLQNSRLSVYFNVKNIHPIGPIILKFSFVMWKYFLSHSKLLQLKKRSIFSVKLYFQWYNNNYIKYYNRTQVYFVCKERWLKCYY